MLTEEVTGVKSKKTDPKGSYTTPLESVTSFDFFISFYQKKRHPPEDFDRD